MTRELCIKLLIVLLPVFPLKADEIKHNEITHIPYKTEATPLQQHGSRVGWVLIGFLLTGWGIYLYINKKNPRIVRQFLSKKSSSSVKILDHVRLNARTNLYVVEFDQKKLLIGQVGETVTKLAETTLPKIDKEA